MPTLSALSRNTPDKLISCLSYSNFKHLIDLEDNTRRAFYEIECIQGNWSVRELKRQIGSLYYERSGLSHDKKKLSELANQAAEQSRPELTIRDPYIFEFLGLKSSEVGILLCTDKNHALVEYALAGMDNQLFVSKYQLELPKKEDMERFIEEQIQAAE